MPDVIDLADRYRKALLARDAAALGRIIEAYRQIYQRLEPQIKLLQIEIDAGRVTPANRAKLARYHSLMANIYAELERFQSYIDVTLSQEVRFAVRQGIADASGLMGAAASGANITFRTLDPEAVEMLLGFLDRKGMLFTRLENLAGNNWVLAEQALIDGLAAGTGVRATAGILKALGAPLNDALRMVRTAQLWAYREATRAEYIANGNIVSGWVWNSALDPRTCMSCIALHGSIHPLSEPLRDHYNGRCTMVPLLTGMSNPVSETGESWFGNQDETTQRSMMGPGKFKLYKSGGLKEFTRLSKLSTDDVYGTMFVETPLKEL